MDWLTSPEAWIALVTLTFLEIVLGVDNVIFISILAGKLPADQQKKARQVGLGLAMFMRIGAAGLAGLDRQAHQRRSSASWVTTCRAAI